MEAAPGMVTRKQKEHDIDVDKADDFVKEQHPPQHVAQRVEKLLSIPVFALEGEKPSVGKVDLTTTEVLFHRFPSTIYQ
jgi:hypothetical protein